MPADPFGAAPLPLHSPIYPWSAYNFSRSITHLGRLDARNENSRELCAGPKGRARPNSNELVDTLFVQELRLQAPRLQRNLLRHVRVLS
jgi:hypothetical protein